MASWHEPQDKPASPWWVVALAVLPFLLLLTLAVIAGQR